MDQHPLTASERGDNAYYLGGCKHAEHNPPYAACLDKIKRVRAGDKGVSACCVDPIKSGACQAVHMQKTEELAGHALYYVPRKLLEQGIVKTPPWAVPPDKSPVTKRDRNPEMDDLLAKTNGQPKYGAVELAGSFADAINAAMKSSVAPVAPAPTPAPAPAAAPTSAPTKPALETPFARMKRLQQQRKGESQ